VHWHRRTRGGRGAGLGVDLDRRRRNGGAGRMAGPAIGLGPRQTPLASFSRRGLANGLPWNLRPIMPSGLLSLLLEGFGCGRSQ
jgi:hypothetical protein